MLYTKCWWIILCSTVNILNYTIIAVSNVLVSRAMLDLFRFTWKMITFTYFCKMPIIHSSLEGTQKMREMRRVRTRINVIHASDLVSEFFLFLLKSQRDFVWTLEINAFIHLFCSFCLYVNNLSAHLSQSPQIFLSLFSG